MVKKRKSDEAEDALDEGAKKRSEIATPGQGGPAWQLSTDRLAVEVQSKSAENVAKVNHRHEVSLTKPCVSPASAEGNF